MPCRNPSPPPAELLSLLRYDPATGVIVWTNTLRGRPAGRVAGSLDKDGYRIIGYDGRTYRAHHLAWWISNGEWPTALIDHENGNPDDNRLSNLRTATQSQNSSNRKMPATNTSGFKGVMRHHKSGRFNAQIKDGGKTVFLGSFETAAEAARAYDAAALRPRGEFARLNFPIASARRAATGEPVAGRLSQGPYRPRKTTRPWDRVVVVDLRDYAAAA